MNQADEEEPLEDEDENEAQNRVFVWGSNLYWQLGFEVDGGEESVSIPH
jgi:hypothetical protein